MRELKFRAWDSERKTYDHEELLLAPNGEIWASRWQELCEPESKYIIEPYTGLKDKNGKEIYEGDIIREEIDFNSKMTDGTFKYRVYWDEEELCWCLEHIGNESIHHELWQCNQSTEVIGNIHENPELLEQDNAKD